MVNSQGCGRMIKQVVILLRTQLYLAFAPCFMEHIAYYNALAPFMNAGISRANSQHKSSYKSGDCQVRALPIYICIPEIRHWVLRIFCSYMSSSMARLNRSWGIVLLLGVWGTPEKKGSSPVKLSPTLNLVTMPSASSFIQATPLFVDSIPIHSVKSFPEVNQEHIEICLVQFGPIVHTEHEEDI